MQRYWPGEFLALFSQNKVKVVFYDHKTHPIKIIISIAKREQ